MKKTGTSTRYRGVFCLGNGKYRVRAYYTDPKTGRARERERVVNAKSVQAALDKKRALERALQEGERDSNKRKRLGDVANDWLTHVKARVRSDGSAYLTPLTQRRYERSVRDHIVPFLGAYVARELSSEDVESWRDHLVASGYRATTVNGHLRVLRLVLDRVKNPAAREVTALPEDDTFTTEDDPNLLDEEELRRFLDVARTEWPQHYALILVLFSTAMRIGTALALRWEDLDEERGIIRVRRRISGTEVLPGVKRSRRSADFPPLWPEVVTALEAHRASLSDEQLASGLVFPSEAGGLRSRSVLNKPFKAILAVACIDKRLTPSSGPRRTAARLYRKVADSAVAKAVAGHLTDEMHRHYAPVDVEEKHQAASRLRSRLRLGTGTATGTPVKPGAKPGTGPGRAQKNRDR